MLKPKYRVTQEQVRLSAARPVSVSEIPRLMGAVRPHDHDYFECTVVVRGRGAHRIEAGSNPLHRGRVLVLAPEEVHGYELESRGELGVWNLYYLAEWLLADLPLLWSEPHLVGLFLGKALFPRHRRGAIPEFTLAEGELRRVVRQLIDLREELGRAKPSLIGLKSGLLQILILLARGAAQSEEGPPPLAFREEVWGLIQRVDEQLRRGERFDLAKECRQLGLTRDHASRLFREATGRTPTEYYQMRRIQQACVRLLEPEVNLTAIALDLQFSDSAHFSRLFRRHRGISPSEYHRRYGKCGIDGEAASAFRSGA